MQYALCIYLSIMLLLIVQILPETYPSTRTLPKLAIRLVFTLDNYPNVAALTCFNVFLPPAPPPVISVLSTHSRISKDPRFKVNSELFLNNQSVKQSINQSTNQSFNTIFEFKGLALSFSEFTLLAYFSF